MRESLQSPMLRRAGFAQAPPAQGLGGLWSSWRCEGPECTGWFHFLSPGPALWSITIHDFIMRGDYIMDVELPSYLTVTWFKSIAGEEFSPRRRLRPNSVWGQSIGGGPWKGVARGGVPVQSVSIEVTPEFSARFLDGHYAGRFRDVERAFAGLGAADEFPEMRALLSRLWPRPGDPEHGGLYYEGKVLQAMGLIVERSRRDPAAEGRPVSPADRDRLRDVAGYIDDHCSADLRIGDLARIACMSPTKFKETFKRLNGQTVFRYVQGRRMSRAELLLRQGDLTIEQVGRSVGYTCASRFSALFKREVGMLPSEYRRRLDV
mgnify:FL=1